MQPLIFASSVYSRFAAHTPKARLINYYWEQSPVSETGEVFIPRPACAEWLAGAGELRGIFRAAGTLDGDIFTIEGENLYQLGVGATRSLIGIIDGVGRVSVAGNSSGIMIATGVSLYYYDGTTLSTTTLPFINPISVGFMAGHWFCVAGGTFKRFWTQDINPTTWGALDFDSASSQTDPLIASVVTGSRIWDIGEKTIEFRYASGDVDAPFTLEQGRAYERGCKARDSIVALDNTIFWVGDDNIIYRGADVPTAIADNSISELIAKTQPDDIYAFGFAWQGHVFYCLTIGDLGTYLYDLTTSKWFQWQTFEQTRWLPSLGCNGFDGLPMLGDISTGALYTLNSETWLDGSLPVVGVLTAGLPIKAQRASVNSVRIEMATGHALATGQGSVPLIKTAYSKDGGFTFGDFRLASLGEQGQYNFRVIERRLGQFKPPLFVMEIEMSDPIPRRISGGYINGDF
jgi:hypothetical protein